MSEKLLGYCGLYCGDCFFYKAEIASLAKQLRKLLRQAKLHKHYEEFSRFASEFQDFPTCYRVLGAMVRMRCRGCRQGGGPPFCRIRRCAQRKALQGCWQCDELNRCTKLDFLRPAHGDAHIKNLRKIKKLGLQGFLEGKRHW
ncbi:MAG: DUF3795 domain-containing protein [Nitrospirae bacterium]|nr:MAG: DUF3795 domain-containing protein [Nitrospirota bacterium]